MSKRADESKKDPDFKGGLSDIPVLQPMDNLITIQDLQHPNTQFIKRAVQFNKLAKVYQKISEELVFDLKISNIRSISLRTGTGFLINSEDPGFGKINKDDIIEIMDYDPVRNNLIAIGNGDKPPVLDTTIHWFIYRGLTDVNVILLLNVELNDAKFVDKLPSDRINSFQYSENLFNTTMALDLLQSLKTSGLKPTILDGNAIKGIVILGNSVTEIIDQLKDIIPIQEDIAKPETESNK
jgi:hypothetical protein